MTRKIRNAVLLAFFSVLSICGQTLPMASVNAIMTKETGLLPAGTQFIYNADSGNSPDTVCRVLRVTGANGVWCSTNHQPYRLVIAENQLPAGELLIVRHGNPLYTDVFAYRGGLWPSPLGLYFTTITTSSPQAAKTSYRLRNYQTMERIVGVGDGVTLQFSDGPVTGPVTKCTLGYPTPAELLPGKAATEYMFVEIQPTGSSQPARGIVHIGSGSNNSTFAVSTDLRDYTGFDGFRYMESEAYSLERRVWVDITGDFYFPQENSYSITLAYPNSSWTMGPFDCSGTSCPGGYTYDDLTALFGPLPISPWLGFSNYWLGADAQNSLLMEYQLSNSSHIGYVGYYDRILEISHNQNYTDLAHLFTRAAVRFDRQSSLPVVPDIMGKLAVNKSFHLLALQVSQEGGDFSNETWLPNAFALSQINEVKNGVWDPINNRSWTWTLPIRRGDTLPGGEVIDQLSESFSGGGTQSCHVTFSTTVGGFNGTFGNLYSISRPCITNAPWYTVTAGQQFLLTGENLNYPQMTTEVSFYGSSTKLTCTVVNSGQPNCNAPTNLAAGTYTLQATVTDSAGDKFSSNVFTLNLQAALPVLAASTNAASFATTPSVSPGEWLALFGSWPLATDNNVACCSPLPTTLGGVQVFAQLQDSASATALPLLYAGKTQINSVFPFEFKTGTKVDVWTVIGTQTSSKLTMDVIAATPATFNYLGGPIMLDSNGQLASSFSRGGTFTLYLNGLGSVNPSLPSGTAAPMAPLSWTIQQPQVILGGKQCVVQNYVLTPGLVSVWEFSVVVPSDTPTGKQSLVINQAGSQSLTYTVTVN